MWAVFVAAILGAGTGQLYGQSLAEFGAVADGMTDDSDALQRAVDAGIGTLRFPRGVYRITKTIRIDLDRVGPTAIVGEGPARVVMSGPGPALLFVGTHAGTAGPSTFHENVWQNQRTPAVSGLEIVGDHDEASGIKAIGTMQLTISRVVIRRSLHGIHLATRNRNVLISDCHIYENRGAGIFYDAVNLHQSNIVGCHISYNDGGGVVIRGGDVRNVHVGTCDIEGNMGGPGSPPTANLLFDSTGGSIGELAVVGCTIQHDHESPDSANIRVNGNSTKRPFTAETRHGNITIADNVLSDVQVNVDLMNTRGVTVTGNTIWKGYEHNLRVVNCDSVVVSNNVFDRNPRYHYGDGAEAKNDLVFRGCDGCTVNGNLIHGAAGAAALSIESSSRFNITANTILDSQALGLLLRDVSASRVSDCLIRSDVDRSEPANSLQVTGGKENMVVNNMLKRPYVINSETSRESGNFVLGEE